MRVRRLSVAIAILVSVAATVPCAWADPIAITTLFNTGVANDGTPLPIGVGAVDPHYSLIASPEGPNTYVVFPQGDWVPNTSTSEWISPEPGNGGATGNYTYSTTFSLPNKFNSKKDTASISGFWASDNNGIDILINGNSTGNSIPFRSGDLYSFQYLTPFAVTSGFQKGLNTLDFVIWQDGGSYSGIQVQMTGTYDLKPGREHSALSALNQVPEPSTLALLGIGILGLIGYRWRYGRN